MSEPPTIWFDASTCRRWVHCGPVGLSRVESNVLKAATSLPPRRVRFCYFDRYSRSMRQLSHEKITHLLDSFGDTSSRGVVMTTRKRGVVRNALNQVERNIRMRARTQLIQCAQALAVDRQMVSFRPGDVLVLTGEYWSQPAPQYYSKLMRHYGVRPVAFCHDMIPWMFPHQIEDQCAVQRFIEFMRVLVDGAALIVTNSQSTQRDLLAFARTERIAPAPTETMILGADLPPNTTRRPRELSTRSLEDGFVLTVGTIQVRKNQQLLYQVWRRYAEQHVAGMPRLVIAGAPGWLTEDLVRQIRSDPSVADRVLLLQHVSDEELAWLYDHCLFTVYPSLYEGWGLPIVESFRHGKACIASSTSSMPEASQGYALHLDPLDFSAWFNAILNWTRRPKVLARYERKARDRYQHRSWTDFSEGFVTRVMDAADGKASDAA